MTALDRLADRCGIQHTSLDAFGQEHVTSSKTKRALLTSMHFASQDEEQAQASLDQLECAEWSRVLPPVLVAHRQDKPIRVPLILRRGAGPVQCTVQLERGGTVSRVVNFCELPLLESRDESATPLEKRLLSLPADLPWGYHFLAVGDQATCSLIVSPGECYLPQQTTEGKRLWGVAAQLYLLRSKHNWGIGDFTDLRELVQAVRSNGADAVGINPLHAVFPDQPELASPYSPSDRLLLNVLYIDLEAVPELAASAEAQALIASADFQSRLTVCRDNPLVDYTAVAGLKLPVLALLYAAFQKQPEAERHEAFHNFVQQRKELLERACLFQALRAYFTAESPANADCNQWPEEFRSSRSPQVADFARDHSDLVQFQLWMQWVADEQLRAAGNASRGMGVGLYRDLAVGTHPSGAEVWSYPDALVSGASVGAPPDTWNTAGQNWGLPPLHPIGARECGYRNFIELVQANMRYAGALRIDHALALQRLYWIPDGEEPKDGAYVHYPTDDLIGILALESHRNRCMVIGEDLGTVPKGFRERAAEANILSYRVLLLERDDHGFVPSDKYPRLSLSVASSHDLPTLAGWWQGADLTSKQRLHQFKGVLGTLEARATREKDRKLLCDAFRKEGLLQSDCLPDVNQLCDTAHAFLAKTYSMLTLMQLDDITREEQQVNVPATTEENPNWRRKLFQSLEGLSNAGAFTRAAALMSNH